MFIISTRQRRILAFLAILFIGNCYGIEFYVSIPYQTERCFEEHLAGQTLVTGEIFYERNGYLSLKIRDPSDNEILTRVLLYYPWTNIIGCERRKEYSLCFHYIFWWSLYNLHRKLATFSGRNQVQADSRSRVYRKARSTQSNKDWSVGKADE